MNLKPSQQFTPVSRTLLAFLLLGMVSSGTAFAAGSSSPTNASTQNATGSNTGAASSTDRTGASASRTNANTQSTGTANTYASSSDASGKMDRSARRFVRKANEIEQKKLAYSELAQTRATNPQVKSFAQKIVSEHTAMSSELALIGGADVQNVALRSSARTADSAAAWNSSHPNATDANTANADSTGTAGVKYTSQSRNGAGTDNSNLAATGTTSSAGVSTSGGATVGEGGMGTGAYAGNPDDDTGAHGWAYRRLANKSGADFDKAYLKAIIDQHEDAIKAFEKAANDKDDPAVQAFATKHLSTLREHLTEAQQLQKSIG
jgi:predicted outer membrane protein